MSELKVRGRRVHSIQANDTRPVFGKAPRPPATPPAEEDAITEEHERIDVPTEN